MANKRENLTEIKRAAAELPYVQVSEFHILADRLGWDVSSAVAKGEDLLRKWMYEEERAGRIKLNPPPLQPKK